MARYLKYIIENEEPVRIADDSRSQSGQTETLHYIAGSTIRGVVISAIAADEAMAETFECNKQVLFTAKVRFLNAYPVIRMKEENKLESFRELMPVPLGFYEYKGNADEKTIQNVVVSGNIDSAMKRARIGDFAYIENGCIYGASIRIGSDLKIKKKLMKKDEDDRAVFRNQYIERGCLFAGYIVLEDETFADYIADMFTTGKVLYLGNGKSAGSGRCRVLSSDDVTGISYADALDEDKPDSCYMMLMSDTVMRKEDGEYCGLDLGSLAGMFDVKDLRIERCATSSRNVCGYNSTWKKRTPSVNMYQKGSVFLLKYKGTLTKEKMAYVMGRGIGIRRNEGFGQVLFLKGYEDIVAYSEAKSGVIMKKDYSELTDDDRVCLEIVAKASYRQKVEAAIPQYILNNYSIIGGNKVSNNVRGVLESQTTAYRYQFKEAKKVIDNYLQHAVEKQKRMRVQKEHTDFIRLKKAVDGILNLSQSSLEKELGINSAETYMTIPREKLLTDQELGEIKLTILTGMIRYHNKKGA